MRLEQQPRSWLQRGNHQEIRCLRRGTSGSRMDAAAWSKLSVAEVGACPSPHHRPRQSRGDQAPRVKVVRPVGRSTLTRGASRPLPGGWADGDGMTSRARFARRRAWPYIYRTPPRASPTVALGRPGVHVVNRGESIGSRQIEQQVSGPVALPERLDRHPDKEVVPGMGLVERTCSYT